MRFSTLQGWLNWLESCHPQEIELGLDRIGKVAKAMSLSLDHFKVVTVAGTNGKGSCVASLNALLRSANLKVGVFTSPHLLAYNERILIDNIQVTDQLLMEAFERIDQARNEVSLSYFEFGTLAALTIFQHADLDVVLLEVGLGGRLDATNIIDADISVVTAIDLDHQDWLGNDREQIGREKAGIFRAGRPAVSAGHAPPDSLKQHASDIGASFIQAGVDFTTKKEGESDRWSWEGISHAGNVVRFDNLPSTSLHLESVAAAIQVAQLLNIQTDNINYQCLTDLTLTGRYQKLEIAQKHVVLDVAHNPAAASYLCEKLEKDRCVGQTFALVAIMADKDIQGILTPLASQIDVWYPVTLHAVPRAMPGNQLAEIIGQLGSGNVNIAHSVEQALAEVLRLMTTEDRLVVFGSFFTVADVLDYNRKNTKNMTMTIENTERALENE